jgi:hypothetical protein
MRGRSSSYQEAEPARGPGPVELAMRSARWLGPASTLLIAVPLGFWAFWGSVELYWEAWGLPFPEPLFYLAPAVCIAALGLVAVTWPRLGGRVLIVVGGAIAAWVITLQLRRGAELTLGSVLAWIVIVGLPALGGLVFLAEARRRRTVPGPRGRLARHGHQLFLVALPLMVFIAVSAYWLPIVSTRVDDGRRDAARLETSAGVIVWAPAGPGWNARTARGGLPSWAALARYGVLPAGLEGKSTHAATAEQMATSSLCAYLSPDGHTLSDTLVGSWRMPTTTQVVASLVRDGRLAGCTFDPEDGTTACDVTPDKETPLWAPDESPIYLWTADVPTPGEARYVGYNGAVGRQPIGWGNPRHGYRCVRSDVGVSP